MKKGQVRKNMITSIYFTEADNWIEISTSNTSLKRRLRKQEELYPETCARKEVDGKRETYTILRKNLSFRILPPSTEKRHQLALKCGHQFGFKKK